MSDDRCSLLAQLLLRQAIDTEHLTLGDWDYLIRLSRATRTLAQLHCALQATGALDAVPHQALWHLESATRIAQTNDALIRFELTELGRVFASLGLPAVLLKGAAYLAQKEVKLEGRLSGDIDLMVPFQHLRNVEAALKDAGFRFLAMDSYDSAYYRRWMHELPPMRHFLRTVTLDLHHAILPRTAVSKPSSELLFDAALSLTDRSALSTLSPVDQAIHNIAHLLHDGEFQHGFRDSIDLLVLLERVLGSGASIDELLARARSLDLYPVVSLGLDCLKRNYPDVIANSVLGEQLDALPAHRRAKPLARIYALALRPYHPSMESGWVHACRYFAYLRAHTLRMPIKLLIPHLTRKALKRAHDGSEKQTPISPTDDGIER